MDTIEDHHNKHIIQDQYCSWKKEKWNTIFFRRQLDTIEDHHNKLVVGSVLLMKNWKIFNKKNWKKSKKKWWRKNRKLKYIKQQIWEKAI